MTQKNTQQTIEAIYEALHSEDGQELDALIKGLKEALKAEGLKEAIFEPDKLAQANREGRKRMQSYFKKRGVVVAFAK